MKRSLILLILAISIVFLTGCYCCPTCPPVQTQTCRLEITAGYWIWGMLFVNGQSTGEWLDFETRPTVTIEVPCNQVIYIYFDDLCDKPNSQSRTEVVYINQGINYLYFDNWYGKGMKGIEGRGSREYHD
jgi:hypothetical protein